MVEESTVRSLLSSAEMTLFNILLIFTSFIGGISVAYFWMDGSVYCKIAACLLALIIIFMICRLNYKYVSSLLLQYKCVSSGLTEDLSIPFNKAWMLHCYVDDDEFNPANQENSEQ